MHTLFYFAAMLLIVDKSVQRSTDGGVLYEGYKAFVVKGQVDVMENFKSAFKESARVIYVEKIGNENNYLVAADEVTTFEEKASHNHLDIQLVYEDFSKVIETEKKLSHRSTGFSWDAYYDVDAIYQYLETIHKSHPNITKIVVGGKSYENRPILGLRIVTPTLQKRHKSGEYIEEDMEKPAVIIESGIHAREWITPATTTYFINELLTSDDIQMKHLRDTYDWHIFPTVNPDGYHYSYKIDRMWRKTRAPSSMFCYGADPNRNWDYNWGVHGVSKDPCNHQVYAGSKPFSEIETRTFAKYIQGVRNLSVYIALHADAQMLLLPYSDSVEHEDNYDDLVKIGTASLEYGRKVNGAEYRGPATAAEILYKASGGSMDWVRNALATPLVFTYELRGRFFHWPPHRIPEQGDELTQMILGLVLEGEKLKYF